MSNHKNSNNTTNHMVLDHDHGFHHQHTPPVDVPPVKINITKSIVPPKPVTLDHLVIDVHIKLENREHVYSNILVALVCTMSEDEYLKMVKSDPIMEEVFLRNKVFAAYLLCYRPKEYDKVKSDLYSTGKIKSKNPHKIHNAHVKLFPGTY